MIMIAESESRRCSLFYNGSFHKSYSQGRRASGGSGLEPLPDEGAMLLEALEVLGFFVRGTLLPESPQDLQPTFAQATKSARMTMAGIPFGSIVNLSPLAGLAAFVHPQMYGAAQNPVTSPANIRFADLAGLVAHRANSGQAHQALGVRKDLASGADLTQQPRRQLLPGTGQGTKNVVVGMFGKSLVDLAAIFVNLPLQTLQNGRQTHSQQRFCSDHWRAGIELLAARPQAQPMRGRIRAPKLMNVQELLPTSFACLLQSGGCRERPHKSPSERFSPVLEAFQRDRIIFTQGHLKLIDQSRALFDQNDFVAADQPQSRGRFILRVERQPGMTIGAQGIGQSPGVMAIGFGATGDLALAIALGGHGIDRIERVVPLQQLVNDHAARRFDGQRTLSEWLHLLIESFPSFKGVLELEVGDNRPDPIYDDHVMVLFGPIQGREIRLLSPMSIHVVRGAQSSWHTRRVRPDTGALVGRCSLSTWPGCRRWSRRSTDNPRGVRNDKPWLQRGQLFTAAIIARGKVIHHLRPTGALTGALASAMNNFGKRIRGGILLCPFYVIRVRPDLPELRLLTNMLSLRKTHPERIKSFSP